MLTSGRRGGSLALVCAVAVLAASATLTAGARADSCTSPDLVETIPAPGAKGVPLNASLFAHYQANAQYLGEPVTLAVAPPSRGSAGPVPASDAGAPATGDAGGDGGALVSLPATVTFDSTEGLLDVTPVQPLQPELTYVVRWPSLRGIDTATLGTKTNLTFTTGTAIDTEAPTFAGITSVSWDVSREKDSCTNRVEERYVFDIGLGTTADDGGRDALTLVLFETSGPGVDASAPRPVLIQRLPPAGQGVTLTSTDLVGHVCFAAIVRDLTGKPSTSGPPVCVDTVAPPFFYSCGVSAGRRLPSAEAATVAAILLLFGRRRVSRRRAPGPQEGCG